MIHFHLIFMIYTLIFLQVQTHLPFNKGLENFNLCSHSVSNAATQTSLQNEIWKIWFTCIHFISSKWNLTVYLGETGITSHNEDVIGNGSIKYARCDMDCGCNQQKIFYMWLDYKLIMCSSVCSDTNIVYQIIQVI